MKYSFECGNLYSLIKQFFKFGMVGVSNTLISLVIYYVLIYVNVHYLVANTIGFIISVLNAYFWNSKYVFEKKSANYGITLLKTFVSYGSTFILSTLLLFIMVKYLSISQLIAPIVNLLVTVPLNFLLNKFWTFK